MTDRKSNTFSEDGNLNTFIYTTQGIFIDPITSKQYDILPVDTLLIKSSTIENNQNNIKLQYAHDPTVHKIKNEDNPCIKCSRVIKTHILIGEQEQSVFICKCGYVETIKK